MVERRDRVEYETLGDGDEACVKASERMVAVLCGQLRDSCPVLCG
jgi:hypothetical protein